MDLPGFFSKFFAHPDVQLYLANGHVADWSRDWQYYNQFFAELSQRVDVLIPYENTNPYIIYNEEHTPKLQFKDLPPLDHIIYQRTKGSILLMHVGVFWDEEDGMGNSCLLVLDVDSGVQEFVNPCGFYKDDYMGLAVRMSYTSLVDGFNPVNVMQPIAQYSVQHVFENEAAVYGGTCGVMCVLLGVVIAQFECSGRETVDAIVKHYLHRHKDAHHELQQMITWYHHGFLESHEGLKVPIVM
jgi:hypothetical protein